MIKNDNERIAITLTKKEIEQVEKLASKQGVTKSIIVKLALSEYLKNNGKK